MPPKFPITPLRCPQWRSVILPLPRAPQQLPPTFLLPLRLHQSHPFARSLSSAHPLRASKQKHNHQRAEAKLAASSSDPTSFEDFAADIEKIYEGLRADLGGIRIAAVDVARVEELRVRLRNDLPGSDGGGGAGGGTGAKGSSGDRSAGQRRGEGKKAGGAQEGGGVVGVGDVASVYRKGREIVVAASEKEYIKPLLSALSTLSTAVSPTQSPTSPLEIHVPIPTTTSEDRTRALKQAQERGQAALDRVNAARGEQKKRLKAAWLKSKGVGGEEMKKLEGELEKRNKAAGEQVRKLVEEGKKKLERG